MDCIVGDVMNRRNHLLTGIFRCVGKNLHLKCFSVFYWSFLNFDAPIYFCCCLSFFLMVELYLSYSMWLKHAHLQCWSIFSNLVVVSVCFFFRFAGFCFFTLFRFDFMVLSTYELHRGKKHKNVLWTKWKNKFETDKLLSLLL